MDRFQRFIQTLKTFAEERLEYKLIGGVAVILHGLPRLTEDIDILVKTDVENIKTLKRSLFKVFNDPSIEDIELDDLEKYSVVRYGTPDGFSIDLIRGHFRTVMPFTVVVIAEVVYFFSISILWLVPKINMSVAAATGVANGGLMIQFIILLPIWAPIVLRVAKRKQECNISQQVDQEI